MLPNGPYAAQTMNFHSLFFLFHSFSLYFPSVSWTLTVISLCVSVFSSTSLLSLFIISSFPTWLGFFIRSCTPAAVVATFCRICQFLSFTHFSFFLSECSSKCRSPKINCCLMGYWECARNWNQTQSSTPKILFLCFWVLVGLVRLHIHSEKKLLYCNYLHNN